MHTSLDYAPSPECQLQDLRTGRSSERCSRWAWSFPALVVLLVVALGLAGLSGSSLGIYAMEAGATESEAGVLAGPPRMIRTDEWNVRTPWVLRQAELGLPATVAGGVGTHDMALLSDLPTAGWELILRPHTAWYFFLGVERAFSLEWWSFYAVQLLGVFSLLVAITKRPFLAALSASMMTLSPATQWWAAPGTFTTVGYGSAAMACMLFAYQASTRKGRVALSFAAGYLSAAFLVTLYIPWQVGTVLVVGPVGISALAVAVFASEDRRAAVRRLLVVGGITVGVAGCLSCAFAIAHRETIGTIASTVYPGSNPAAEGGKINLSVLLSATFDYFSSQKPFVGVNGTNQSENSSALVLVLPVSLACILLFVMGRFQRHPSAGPLLGCLVGGAVMASWMLLPIPAWIGRFALLTRVTPSRLFLPLGLAGVVALALLINYQAMSRCRIPRWIGVTSAAVFAAAQAWGATKYTVEGRPVDLRLAAVFILIVTTGVILALGRRPAAGLVVLALFTFWQASMINPFQRGVEPLTATPLRKAIDAVRVRDQGGGWVAFSGDRVVKGTLTASGANNLSGVSPYPDADSWRILDPESDDEDVWNRYAHVSFLPGHPGQAATFELTFADSFTITVDPCSAALEQLGVRFMVAQGFELHTCVRPLARVAHGDGFVAIYERRRVSS